MPVFSQQNTNPRKLEFHCCNNQSFVSTPNSLQILIRYHKVLNQMSDSASETVAPPPTKRIKLSESENEEDRLSDLPESVILHTLSFLNTKRVVQTCVLSTRWKDLWKRLPALKLHSADFGAYKKFTRLVSKVLSLRDSSISLHSLDFKRTDGRFEPALKKIVNYALSHNVQQLGLDFNGDIAQIPPAMFSCQTVTHLKLSIYNGGTGRETLFPKSLNLPALTDLQLGNFAFEIDENGCAEPFSSFNKMSSLLICNCTVRGATTTLYISSVTLVNLTIYNHRYDKCDFYQIDLCTPSLCKFVFNGTPYLQLSGSNVSSLKHVDIDVEVELYQKSSLVFLISWLIEFANIKSLTVSATTLQALSLYPNLLKIKLPSLHNLKSLVVNIDELSYGFLMTLMDAMVEKAKSKREAARIRKAFKAGLEPSSPIPDGIVDFLKQNSPFAKVDYIDCLMRPYRERYI